MTLSAQAKPFFQKALQAWSRLNTRDKRALIGLALFIGLTATHFLVATPFYRDYQHVENQLKEERLLYQHIQQAINHHNTNAITAIPAEALASTVTQTSRSAGLELEELESSAPGQVSLSVEGPLEKLLLWIDRLEQHRVIVSSFSIDVNKTAIAKARLQLSVH
ncbi:MULTISPECIES: type II secretion system protein GspM [Pseudomonas]|jgi:general secretion pathway protein M|uniref:type II secretion system protein GspM n=1 Tax=Pseudomonas TaxID=286 RepID=UPI00099B5CBF|nr:MULTISPECIES: type II secretion system protein GspM [Pseudomonas]MCK3838882.1 hypothetical protein [Pseudomonas sp. NCIMB 10586]OPB05913.1 hypothetical protein BFW89_09860 [Pseudomonas synxantha]VCU67847.1 Hypothetical new protein [Pseudomonas synxantha]